MDFSIHASLEILTQTPATLNSMLSHLSAGWTHTNEGEGTWSVFDVIGHLVHGERTDWIPRTRIMISDIADKQLEPFDRFAQYETSKGKSLAELLQQFTTLRKDNISALRQLNLTAADLAKTAVHPHFGEVQLQPMLAAYTVHDLNHIAQIARIMATQYKQQVGPWQQYLRILQA